MFLALHADGRWSISGRTQCMTGGSIPTCHGFRPIRSFCDENSWEPMRTYGSPWEARSFMLVVHIGAQEHTLEAAMVCRHGKSLPAGQIPEVSSMSG